MKLILNQESIDIPESCTLADLMTTKALDQRFVGVAINGSVIRREAWRNTQLHAHDEITVIRPFQGG